MRWHSGESRPGVPRTHILYAALAVSCVAALTALLYLSHQIISVHGAGVAANVTFDRQLASTIALTESASDLQAAALTSFETRAMELARANVKSAAHEFKLELARLKAELERNLPQASRKRAAGIIAGLNKSIVLAEKSAMATMVVVETRDPAASMKSMTKLMIRFDSVRWGLRDIDNLLARIKSADTARGVAEVERMRRIELGMGALFVAVILGLCFYGIVSGRMARQGFINLQATNARLAEAHAVSIAQGEDMRQVNEQVTRLNLQLSENMKQLREAQDQLIRKGRLSQLGELTATVAHELRNPLGAVRTSAFLLARKLKGRDLGVENQIERIEGGIVRCDDIITQLLDFARASSPEYETRDFDGWLTAVVAEEALRLPRMVAVECRPGLGGQLVAFDPGRLSRALINLLSNASEAMVGKGTDPAKFTTADPRIVVELRATARGIEIAVSDCGPGVAPENMGKILEPLFTTKNFGTGLGLPAVEKIMSEHGGGLGIESTPGHGAVFTVWLPVEVTAERRAAA